MRYINDTDTPAGKGERKLLLTLIHNVRNGYSLAATQTLEMLFMVLCDLRGQTYRELADDMRRDGHYPKLVTELERIGTCGPWIDGHRWRVPLTGGYIIRSDADQWPDHTSKWGVGEAEIGHLLKLAYTESVTRRMPHESQALFERQGLFPRQAQGAPWIGWLKGDDLVAVLSPVKEAGE